jgi:hypothetical protein
VDTYQGHTTIVAAPDDKLGAAIWIVGTSTAEIQYTGPFATGLTGARSVDLDIPGSTGQLGDFAIAAAIGCPPKQEVSLGIGSFTLNAANLPTAAAVSHVVHVATGATADTAPTVFWVGAPYSEWRVTWIGDGALVYLQRFTRTGELIGDPIRVAEYAAAFAGNGAHANVVVAAANSIGGVRSYPIACPASH